MGIRTKLKFKYFRGSMKTWQTLFEEAATFASKQGEQSILNITTSCDHHDAVVTVWYWV
ncbi:MAG: hypothetical protein ACR2NP_16745 [Pirellulaceae bacterium]